MNRFFRITIVHQLLLLASLLLLPGYLFAQGGMRNKSFYPDQNKGRGNISFSGGVGWASYFGDLCPTGDCFTTFRPDLALGVKHRFNPIISARLSFNFYQIYGDDQENFDPGESTFRRNLSFRSNNWELVAEGVVDFMPISDFHEIYANRRDFGVYGIFGIGMTRINPQAELGDEWHDLAPLQTEGVDYSQNVLVIPVGLGARFKIGRLSDILVELNFRWTNSDYLDDVSTEYPDLESFDEPLAAALSDRRNISTNRRESLDAANLKQRGNPDKNDAYYIFNVKYELTIDASDPLLKKRYKLNLLNGKKKRHKRRGARF